MTGTIINAALILVGGFIGLLARTNIADRYQKIILSGLGLFTLAIAFGLFLHGEESLVILGSVLLGSLLGEWLQIEQRLSRLGTRIETWYAHANGAAADDTFVRGFVSASLLFCIGPMAILGSIQDGLSGDFQLLLIKSVMDGFAAMALTTSLGVGVIFSVISVFVYQGAISLLAAQMQTILTGPMINELNAVGGILLLGLAISTLLEIRQIKVGNMLPALILAPIFMALVSLF
ncbi:MAG: DUF554 domain-containing protein [Anaerolineales bacterium]|nr:DUF554 domain-containing protein [Anaerolineales bacterium]